MNNSNVGTLYAPPTNMSSPISNQKVRQFQSTMLFRSNTMNVLSDKGRSRMLSMYGQKQNGNVNKLINTHSRTGGVQVIN